MDPIILSQWQFAIITVYHFFFVPVTLGLSVFLAIMETLYVRTGKEIYKRMVKFWGKLFLINFAMGVVTGIVQEFQFGMNWSEYSRFVGDIFGAPLAIEALLAFFLESTFLGVWIFGWEKLSKKMHLTAIWLVAIGSNLSALWILIANSFMQWPVGFEIEGGRAVMTDFFALITNPYIFGQFIHTISSGFATAAFFILGISAYHLFRENEKELFNISFKMATVIGSIAILTVGGIGHYQAQHMMKTNPMKMIASEGLWDTEDPASMSILTIPDKANGRNILDIRVPGALSFLIHNRFEGEVKGINQLQMEYVQKYGPGDYIPNIAVTNYTFRIMLGVGMLMGLILAYALLMMILKKPFSKMWLFKFLPFTIAFPFLANSSGWLLTEIGRQPWVVFGVMKTKDAVSPNVSVGMVAFSLFMFALVYGFLMVADIYLLAKYAKAGPETSTEASAELGIGS
ncbi:MAG: cytochrome ubiquinol oxidase subunit I [Anaerolineaceae bacterium]|nr:cytochrome ubiquinol oxidase subunit I [Anaerolineaceae bacterium]